MKVAVYLRVSTLVQNYERQHIEIQDYCKRNGHEIVRTYEEKISGAIDEREQFNELCKLTKDDVDGIVVWEISRLGRRLPTIITAIDDFTKKGINIIALKENFQSLDENGKMSSSATLMMSMYATIATIERETIMERTKSGKLNKIKNGQLDYTDAPPFGYKMVDKRLAIDESKAKIVREIYEQYLDGFSQNELAAIHNMHQSQVHRILSNPVYCGTPKSKLSEIPLQSPQIVSVDTYKAAEVKRSQKAIKRAKRGLNHHPLRGKIYCEVGNDALSKKGESWGCHCGKTSIQEKFLDKALKMVMNKYSIHNELQEKKTTDLADLNTRYDAIAKLMYSTVDKLKEAHKKYDTLKTVFSDKELKKEKTEITNLENKLKGYDADLWEVRREIKETASTAELTTDNMRALIEKAIVKIIDRARKAIIFDLIDGTSYTVTVRTRKNEYTITEN